MLHSSAFKTPAGMPFKPGALPASRALMVSSTSFRFISSSSRLAILSNCWTLSMTSGSTSVVRVEGTEVLHPVWQVVLLFLQYHAVKGFDYVACFFSWPSGLFDTLINGAYVYSWLARMDLMVSSAYKCKVGYCIQVNSWYHSLNYDRCMCCSCSADLYGSAE